MKVVQVRTHSKNPKWRYVDLLEDDGKAVNAFCANPGADALTPGQPLPAGWTVEPGQYGPVLRYPAPANASPGGSGRRMEASWRNTEEGFRYEQARMDRRTALMQAVAVQVPDRLVTDLAEEFYAWLRKE